MKRSFHIVLLSIFLLTACNMPQPTEDANQVKGQVETSVAMTVTALIENAPTATETPLPPPTETASPAPTLLIPTVILTSTTVPTPRPAYSCDVTFRRPRDDEKFHPEDKFDIKWTIINNGSVTWESDTYLEYQNGPLMTSTKQVALPKLKPGQTFDVTLDAVAPSEKKMHVMVWAVRGPGTAKDSMYWMCYPYIRIIVDK
ncbi:MAG TPA: NBR1-Ig-like domain-containing protein [Anaerolineales bacterium]|nr:NBR1-Ig-like domain-containing protein [Anaerolineales bacterium]HNN13558.1 NBR1-Ig-like domain-containing protein [Anaerolineales bacterium]HNO30457.1 NBR1-Ig-like domain-containing protein [Anaerolineales bacterium]